MCFFHKPTDTHHHKTTRGRSSSRLRASSSSGGSEESREQGQERLAFCTSWISQDSHMPWSSRGGKRVSSGLIARKMEELEEERKKSRAKKGCRCAMLYFCMAWNSLSCLRVTFHFTGALGVLDLVRGSGWFIHRPQRHRDGSWRGQARQLKEGPTRVLRVIAVWMDCSQLRSHPHQSRRRGIAKMVQSGPVLTKIMSW